MVSNKNKSLISNVLIALLSSALIACSDSANSEKLIQAAAEHQKKGELKAAVIQLKNALQVNSEDAKARRMLGMIYYETGDFASAEKEIRKALSFGSDPHDLLPVLGKTLLYQGKFKEVLADIRQPDGAKPDARYPAVRGNADHALGNHQDAKDAFNNALQLDPDNPDALIGRGRQALAERDLDEALKSAEHATARHPDNIDAWLFRGDVQRTQGKYSDAVASYDKATAIKPDNVAANVARINLHIGSRKFDVARAELATAEKNAPKAPEYLYLHALLEFSQQKYSAALDAILQVLNLAPDHMPSHLLAGAIQFSLGSTKQAENHLAKYLGSDPENQYAKKLLIGTLLKNNDPTGAIKILNSMLPSAENDPQLLALAGQTYMQVKDLSKASEYFEKASAAAPNSAIVRTALGMSRLAQGETARGIAELEIATGLDDSATQASVVLVMTHVRQKEYDKALAVIEKLEKSEPGNPVLSNLKGGVYLQKNDLRAARSSFERAVSLRPDFFEAVANLAKVDLREQQPKNAEKRLRAYLKGAPDNTRALVALASLAMSQQQPGEASKWLEQAHANKPDDIDAGMLLASHYLAIGEKTKGIALAKKLQNNHPDNAGLLDLTGRAEIASGDTANALNTYKKLGSVLPDSPLPHFRMAAIYLSMDDAAAATAALKAALAIKPDYTEAQVLSAMLEMKKGSYGNAVTIARQIQKQSPGAAVGYELEGDLQFAQKKPEPAAEMYEQAFKLNPTSTLLIKLHGSLKQSGKDKQAESKVMDWYKTHPTDTSVRMHLANARLNNGQHLLASEQYQLILKQKPDDLVALNNLAYALQQQKDQRALKFAEKANSLAPNNPMVLDTLGWILVEDGDIRRGLPLLQKAGELAPSSPEIGYHLAVALHKSGDKAGARKALERLLATGKPFANAKEAQKMLDTLE